MLLHLLLILNAKPIQSFCQLLIVPELGEHSALPQLPVIWHGQMQQFIYDNVIPDCELALHTPQTGCPPRSIASP